MGGKGQRRQHRADAPGLSADRRRKPDRGRPDLGNPRGLPYHTHHEKTFELGATISAGNGSETSNAAQNHPDFFHGT